MKNALSIVFFILIGICGNTQINFEYLTADNGLSDNRVQSIYRDSKDYIWIGTTNNGLNKYDGNNITIYEYIDNQPGSISSNNIRYIFEDSRKNLWIGTIDGLNLYDPQSEFFTVFRHNYPDTINNLGNYVTCIFEDKNGNLWITYVQGVGLCKWDYDKKRFIRYRIKDQDNDYYVNSVTSIREDSKGNLWVVSQGPGIYRFEPETGNFIVYNDPAIDFGNSFFKRIFIDNQDKIWIVSFGGGLYLFNPSTGKIKHFGTNVGNKGINSNLVSDIIQTDDHHLLIATDQGGINKYNMVSNTFEYIVQDDKIKHGLNNNGILSLYQDKEGILWVGTSRGGVNYSNPKQYKFRLFDHNDKNPNSLSYNIVGCFYEDSEGLIWIGTDGGGVNVYDPKTGDFTIYKHDPSDPYSISGDVIRCIAEDKDNDMWIGTWDAGLNRYDKRSKRFYHYFPDKKDSSSISSKTTWHLKIDHNDNIWLSSYSRGIEIFNKKKGVVKRFSADSDNPRALGSDDVWHIYEDLHQNIWVCTLMGINLYDSINDSFIVYNNFPDNDIRAFCRDKEGKLWAGSVNQGLFLFEQDGTIVKTYNKKNGLPDNTVHAIVEDDRGNLWISTNKGISQFNQKTLKFKNYYKSDGLQGSTFFQQSFLKTKNGEIYFGGYNGFNSFHPDSIKDNEYIPKVYITDFKLFNKSVPFGISESPLQNHISETKEITLSWRESVFSFEFTAINYTHPEKNEYAYIMEGFEKEWNYIGNKRDATYTNMDAGEYTFKVKASNNDGIWNEEGKSIKVVILPPWWKTWWFRIIVIFVVLYSVYWFFKYRTYQLRKQKILLAKMVRERTLQIEEANSALEEKQEKIEEQTVKLEKANEELQELNSTKDKFFSIIAHDLKNPFGTVLGLAELLNTRFEKLSREKLILYINTINEALNKIYNLLENLLEWSRTQRDKIVIHPQNFEINKLINEVIEIQQEHANSKNLNIEFKMEDNLEVYADKEMISTVLRNLICNAIKFTPQNGKICIETIGTDKQVIVNVSDTGIGIDELDQRNLFRIDQKVSHLGTDGEEGSGLGLILCKEFVEKNNGSIWVDSQLDKGTTFGFELPQSRKDKLN